MAINQSQQVNASVVLTKEVYERIKNVAEREKRSISKQIAYWIEKELEVDDPAPSKRKSKTI